MPKEKEKEKRKKEKKLWEGLSREASGIGKWTGDKSETTEKAEKDKDEEG